MATEVELAVHDFLSRAQVARTMGMHLPYLLVEEIGGADLILNVEVGSSGTPALMAVSDGYVLFYEIDDDERVTTTRLAEPREATVTERRVRIKRSSNQADPGRLMPIRIEARHASLPGGLVALSGNLEAGLSYADDDDQIARIQKRFDSWTERV